MPPDTIQLTIPGALVSVQTVQEPGTLIADRSGWQRAVLRASMPSAAKLVACTLACHLAEAPEFLPAGAAVSGPGLITLQEETGYSRTHVQRQVSLLRRQGWLTTVARPAAGRTTRFALSIPDSMVRDGLVRLVESPLEATAGPTGETRAGAAGTHESSRESGRRRGRRSRAGSHPKGAARRRTREREMATVGGEAQDRAGGFVVDLVPSRDRGPFGPEATQHPEPHQRAEPHQRPEDWRREDHPHQPVDAPVVPDEPATVAPAAPPHPAAPTATAVTEPISAEAAAAEPTDQAAAYQAPAARPPLDDATAHAFGHEAPREDGVHEDGVHEDAADEDAADEAPAPTVPLPPPPPAPMTLAATQVINVLANAMRRPTSDFLEIFGKLQIIFDEDNWDPVTLALHLVHIIQTGVLVGDGDEIDNLSWRLDRLPRASTDCECRSCRERRADQLKSPSAPSPRGRFNRPSGAGRGAGRPAAAEPKRSAAATTEAPPVEIPRPPLEAIERAAQAAREARLRERQQAADGAA
ncbi:hypothetical protein [Frankia sp. AvcI1]|uniref:hypothetical protein n=1 Tax=Frankia sp. AvcI1 TaxID=573496 RepID=UPI0006EC1824|nr:hypothetical protein [Frankia sp. AvcI1]